MRQLVYFIVAVFVISLDFKPSAAQERLNLAYISPNAGSSSVLWIAKDAGIFKKHGLDVNVLYIEGTPKALMSLFAGELHVVAGTGPAVVNAKMRGADATMVMGFEVFLPYYLIANANVKSVEDLKGKVGANHSAATSADFAMRLGLKSIGIDPDRDVSLRVVGATNLRMIAVQQNQAQFTVISNAEREPADKMGFKVLADLASKRIPYPHSGLITSQRIIKERREAMLRFGRATIEAIHFLKTNKPQTIAILKKYAKVDPIALEPAYAYMKTAIPDAPYPTVDGMRTFINEMGRTQPDILKQDPASFVDASIVKAVEVVGFIKRLGR
jgi:NitT/TauT family transport system substrate-binding protein